MKQSAFLGGAAVAAGLVTAARAGVVIYDNGLPDYAIGSPASQLDPVYPFYAAAADDFIFSSADFPGSNTMTVTGVHWWGVSFNPGGVPAIASFRIVFWADAGGVPAGGTPVGNPPDESQAIAVYEVAGNGSQVPDLFGGPNNFEYDLDLPTPLELAKDTPYWIQIQPTLTFPPQWAWQATTGVSGSPAVQGFDILNLPFWTPAGAGSTDLAFNLRGFKTPAPGSVALLGLAGIFGSRRRRRA
jgi:MYXO-CTERM domain-containing protein